MKTQAPRAAERIREVATDLFYREGIRAVGVDEIVARAGVTKPSLYRGFGSKDELTLEILRARDRAFWAHFQEAQDAHRGSPRAQVIAFFEALAHRAEDAQFRGCGLTNAAVEYPDPAHPAHLLAVAHKDQVRAAFRRLAVELGAERPDHLADALQLLLEGTYAARHVFGPGGPSASAGVVVRALLEAFAPEPRGSDARPT